MRRPLAVSQSAYFDVSFVSIAEGIAILGLAAIDFPNQGVIRFNPPSFGFYPLNDEDHKKMVPPSGKTALEFPFVLSNEPFFFQESHRTACLFLHGLGGGPFELRPLADRVRSAGLSVQGIVYPGHDTQSLMMPDSSWEDWLAASRRAFDELRARFEVVHIVGSSTGCPVTLKLAFDLAVETPGQSAGVLVLLSPFLNVYRPPFCPVSPEVLARTLGSVIKHVPRRSPAVRDSAIRKQVRRLFRSATFNMKVTQSALDLIVRVRQILPDIHNDLLIIQSLKDTVVDPHGAFEIQQAVASKTKSLVTLEKSDHLVALDVERDKVHRACVRFLLEHSSI